MTESPDYLRTRSNQRDASDPRASAWVVANAGSGKTHVLTQRVIRLLLDGNDPASILCLTFTKVAAAEMARRIFKELGGWTSLPDADLTREIEELEGRAATADDIRNARRLFARALETPGGLKIQTIHAFCERLLHQFPFEANVPGQFSVMDVSSAAAALATARDEVMNAAAALPGGRLGGAVRKLAEEASDMQIGQALDALIDKRDDLRLWIERSASHGMAGGIDDALADLRRRLGLRPDEIEESVCREICDAVEWSGARCDELIGHLAGSANRTDASALGGLKSISAAGHHAAEAGHRLNFFLAKDGSSGLKARSASHRFGAATRRAWANLEDHFCKEADRLLSLVDRLNLVRAYEATAALLTVGDAILQSYQRAKRQAGALDFNDLIVKTRNLLSRSDATQWVLYKLDRRVEHILVDEAQDTSPDQWMVVQAIAEDFFSGEGAARAPRTIFVVGDDKQSIFRFQGAAPAMLAEMQRFFQKRIEEGRQSFVERPLYLSFRSTHEVLQAVDAVFDEKLANEITASTYTAHASYRPNEPGHVILLPRAARRRKEDPEDWTAPYTAPSAAETELAEAIADEISRIRNTVLPSGKRLRDGEILILVRRRDAFAAAMNRALRSLDIPTAGADRIPVSTHIAVLDLLALADVMLLPEDDLQLAACLKSPLFGLREEELLHVAAGRDRKSLWRALHDATDEPFLAIAATLRRLRGTADQVTPFRFFATILGPGGGRQRFRARLGGEADDVLDTFLSQALAYERNEAPSLQGFVRFVRANEGDIKREAGETAAGVRVMTVHGAKGLEADVVFVADTGGAAVVTQQRKTLVDIGRNRDDPAFLWRRNQPVAPQAQRDADAREDQETEREYLRLLYVAMTRARDILYVGGVRLLKPPPRCWYTVVRDALVPPDVERTEDDELAERYVWPQPLRTPRAEEAKPKASGDELRQAPEWLARSAPSPVPAPEPLRPSAGLAEPDTFSGVGAGAPEAPSGDTALLRGRLLHLLLEHLPSLPAAERTAAAKRFVNRELPQDPELARSILSETEALFAAPALAGLFGPQSRGELAIVGSVETERGDFAVSGRIDRMTRDADGWHVADFKTNRSVPATAPAAPPAYILQLALYRHLLMEMEPGVDVRASLVWTAGPNVMPISPQLMEKALETLGIRDKALP
jgi:ATP-dependent helicase/nuclease subunit A